MGLHAVIITASCDMTALRRTITDWLEIKDYR